MFDLYRWKSLISTTHSRCRKDADRESERRDASARAHDVLTIAMLRRATTSMLVEDVLVADRDRAQRHDIVRESDRPS